MILYQRNISVQIFLLRSIFSVVTFTCMVSFTQGWKVAGCLAAGILLITGFISITSIKVYKDALEIIPGLFIHDDLLEVKKYFFFGFIPVKWSVNKDQADTHLRVIRKNELNEINQKGEHLSDFIFTLFPYSPKFQGIVMKYKIANGDARRVIVKLKDRELKIVDRIFKGDIALPTTKL